MRSHPPLAALLATAALACQRQPAPAPAAPSDKPPERAAGAPTAPPPPTFRTGEKCFAPLDGPASRAQLRKASGKLVLGVVAGLKDASDENLAHLRALAAELKKRAVDAIVADGDLGDTPEDQESLLSALATAGVPILANAGNREVRSDLDAAEESERRKGVTVVDFSHTRVVDLGDALVVGLPGAFERKQLRADGCCAYQPRDVEALQAWLAKLPPQSPPVLLVAAVPPRGQDGRALDFSDGQNVGDGRLAALLQTRRAPFGIFGQVWEAGERAVDLAGHAVGAGAASEQLYLNPGAAERSAWPMNDGQLVPGRAATLTIAGKTATWDVVRAPPAAPKG